MKCHWLLSLWILNIFLQGTANSTIRDQEGTLILAWWPESEMIVTSRTACTVIEFWMFPYIITIANITAYEESYDYQQKHSVKGNRKLGRRLHNRDIYQIIIGSVAYLVNASSI